MQIQYEDNNNIYFTSDQKLQQQNNIGNSNNNLIEISNLTRSRRVFVYWPSQELKNQFLIALKRETTIPFEEYFHINEEEQCSMLKFKSGIESSKLHEFIKRNPEFSNFQLFASKQTKFSFENSFSRSSQSSSYSSSSMDQSKSLSLPLTILNNIDIIQPLDDNPSSDNLYKELNANLQIQDEESQCYLSSSHEYQIHNSINNISNRNSTNPHSYDLIYITQLILEHPNWQQLHDLLAYIRDSCVYNKTQQAQLWLTISQNRIELQKAIDLSQEYNLQMQSNQSLKQDQQKLKEGCILQEKLNKQQVRTDIQSQNKVVLGQISPNFSYPQSATLIQNESLEGNRPINCSNPTNYVSNSATNSHTKIATGLTESKLRKHKKKHGKQARNSKYANNSVNSTQQKKQIKKSLTIKNG